jgi:hypothetical protein
VLNQINIYQLSKYTGKMQIKDWKKAPIYSAAASASGSAETKWVNPETFFDLLPAVLKNVPPLPGEECPFKMPESIFRLTPKQIPAAGFFMVH